MRLRFPLIAALVLLAALPLATASLRAGSDCDDAPLAASLVPEHDVSLAPCQGIRPGGALILRAGPLELIYCTMSFLVTDGTNVYVSTAGHCVEDSLGVPTVGQRVAAHGVPGEFGTVAYQWCEGQAANGGCGAGTDFGLIRIDADKVAFANAAMCGWGAPTGGLYEGQERLADEGLEIIQHFGWGNGITGAGIGWNFAGVFAQPANPATQPREGIVLETNATIALVEAVAFSGDSGSGVMIVDAPVPPSIEPGEARALGVLTHISAGGLAFVQRLDHALERASSEMGVTLTLVTEL